MGIDRLLEASKQKGSKPLSIKELTLPPVLSADVREIAKATKMPVAEVVLHLLEGGIRAYRERNQGNP